MLHKHACCDTHEAATPMKLLCIHHQEVIMGHVLTSMRLALTLNSRTFPDPAPYADADLPRPESDPDTDPGPQSVLPLSNAFATTGITAAFILLAIVMSANCWTAHMLIWQVSYGPDVEESIPVQRDVLCCVSWFSLREAAQLGARAMEAPTHCLCL